MPLAERNQVLPSAIADVMASRSFGLDGWSICVSKTDDPPCEDREGCEDHRHQGAGIDAAFRQGQGEGTGQGGGQTEWQR